MKLSHIQEARYHATNYLDWVSEKIKSENAEEFLTIAPGDADLARDQITERYGKPHKQTFVDDGPERQYYLWQNEIGYGWSFNIILWPQFEEIAVQTFKKLKK